MTTSDAASVGILSAAAALPAARRTLAEVFADEGLTLDGETAARLGIERVPVALGESPSALALAAARAALEGAGIEAGEIDVLVDFTVLPQEYLVPAWNMSNRIQGELGAKNAFTLGFSGGGPTNLHVALRAAADLIRADDAVRTALLLASDAAIPRNRVLHPPRPVTVLGDGASALVVRADAPRNRVLATELSSNPDLHDVCYIPGGALAHPDREDLYRMRLDHEAYAAAPKGAEVARLARRAIERTGVPGERVVWVLQPNLSATDHAATCRALEVADGSRSPSVRASHGHLQATDLVLNLLSLEESGAAAEGDLVLLVSHGMGFTAGACLLRH